MSSDPLIGQTLAQYEITGRLGKGGMATVYRARQHVMQRDVAIKIMSADLVEDPQFVARFEREAQVIANLQHPRILPVHDFGHEGEVFYLVMRLIEGESLYHRLLHGPLSLQSATRYLDQMAEALDYAHARGVIHRDLKPNNILIDEWDNLYLMDFGLAKMLAASQSLTKTGTVMGTPSYMSPEAWRGEAVDARADVYSLGVILYEMVIGHPPFESDTPFTLMYKHLNDAPPPLREAVPDLPQEVEQVILKALAKTPEERYQSAGDLAREFGAVARVAGSLVLRQKVETTEPPASAESAAPPSEPVPAPAVESEPPQAADSEAAPAVPEEAPAVQAQVEIPAPQMIVPPPPRIVPPPPPIPVPGAPFTGPRRNHAPHIPDSAPPGVLTVSQMLQHALDAVDQSLDLVAEKAADAISGPSSQVKLKHGMSMHPSLPVNSLAFTAMQGIIGGPEEPLAGVLDVRGTVQWKMWKRLLVGGLVLNILGGIAGGGPFNALGWIAWIFLIVQVVRTWRGDIGGYYLGFTPDRVILLPHNMSGGIERGGAQGLRWDEIERLRLSDRYLLLDGVTTGREGLHIAALLLEDGDGGLGDQRTWLTASQIPELIDSHGFEVRLTGE